MPEIRHFRAFAAVARAEHFGRAAERLRITQPALSRTIRQLEAAIGGDLLKRTTRRVELTALGGLFLPMAETTLERFEAALTTGARAVRGEIGRISIGHTEVAMFGSLPRILEVFRASYPSVSVALEPGITAVNITELRAGRLDVGFITGRIGDPDLDCLPLWEEPSVVVLAAGHRLARRRHLRLEDLAAETFVMGPSSTWQSYRPLVEAACARAGFAPVVVHEADSSSALVQLIAASDDVTIHPACVRNITSRGVVARELREPSLQVWTSMLLRRSSVSAAALAFAALARQVCLDHS